MMMLGCNDYSRNALRRAQAALARYSFTPFLISESPQAHKLGLCERPHSKRMYARLYGEDMTPQFRKPDRAFIVAMQSRASGRGRTSEGARCIAHHSSDRKRTYRSDSPVFLRQIFGFFAHNVKMMHHTPRMDGTATTRQRRSGGRSGTVTCATTTADFSLRRLLEAVRKGNRDDTLEARTLVLGRFQHQWCTLPHTA